MKLSGWTQVGEMGFASNFPLKQLSNFTLFAAGLPHDTSGVTRLSSDVNNFAACLNEAARHAQTGLLLFLPPDLQSLADGWQQNLLNAANANPTARFFYGNYFWRGNNGDELQTVRHDLGDITEREDWGPAWAVRVEWLLSIGGLDEQHFKAAFYDLLLKSWGDKTRVHIDGAIAVVPARKPMPQTLPKNPNSSTPVVAR
ncbi:MAG: hypothetical protein IPP40_10140 [bacterium]|nr:hypothetical protein [bacterium]